MSSSKSLWKLTAGAVLSLAAQSAFSSDPSHLAEGIRAYEKGHFKQAYTVFASHADTASPKALYYLSALYLSGKGVEEDEFKAFEYCKRAAEEGLAEAQFQLGVMYLEGLGMMNEDEIMALEWLWRAADNGHEHAREMFDFVLNRDFTIGC
jgi:TPR repeat protein